MDEFIDILNENGEITGKTCLKSEAHKKGIFHASVHIWIFDKQKNVLIQKRAATKDIFPNLWDVSVAGHISAGEKPIIAALREVEEEVGILITESDLTKIGTSTSKIHHHKYLIDYELHHIYLCEINFNINSSKIQQEEVAKIKYIKLQKLFKKVTFEASKFVPHGEKYYSFIIEKIKNFNQ